MSFDNRKMSYLEESSFIQQFVIAKYGQDEDRQLSTPLFSVLLVHYSLFNLREVPRDHQISRPGKFFCFRF
jgi:hypothetical protein